MLGQTVTCALGTLTAELDLAITAVSASFNSGTLSGEIDIALSGQSAAFTAGTMSIPGDVTVSITGVTATWSPGQLSVPQALSSDAGARRRERYILRIDGREFNCRTAADAWQLITEAKRLARKLALERSQAAAKLEKPIKLTVPQIKSPTPALAPVVAEAQAEIEQIFRMAALDREIAMWFKREGDDEDTLMLLL